jgi:hypothetical protein
MGGVTVFTQEKADRLCELIAQGVSLRKAAEEIGVHNSTPLLWCKANADFDQQYARAREIGYRLLAEEIIEISDDSSGDMLETDNGPKPNPEMVARSRLRVDSRKWMLSKMLPKIYGEKLDVNHGGNPENPVLVRVSFG